MKYINVLLVCVPITILERFFLHASGGIIFVTCCLGIIPLAVIIGDATEQIALHTGPKIGGFLNATMGNVPELLISGFAIHAGLYSLVLASLAGSILGNILMVMGLSIFVGGLKFKFQTFNSNIMRSNFTLLSFASFSIIMPFALKSFGGASIDSQYMKSFSLVIAIIMIGVYVVGLIFSLFTHRDIFHDHRPEEDEGEIAKYTLSKAIIILAITTGFIAFMSETLIATVDSAAMQFKLSEAFIGIILIPIIGNVAEHASAIIMAYKNKLDISIEIAAGSTMQIALFVTPLMVVLSTILGNTMEYVFTPLELLSMVIAIIMTAFILMDRRTSWIEGFQLFVAYAVIGVSFLMFGL